MEIKNSFLKKPLVTICAAIILVAALLPFMISSAEVDSEYGDYSSSAKISGISAIGGGGGIFAIIMLLCPIALIAMNYIPQTEKYRALIAIIAPAACLGCMIITAFACSSAGNAVGNVAESIAGDSLSTKMSLGIGFYLMLLGSIASFAAGALTYHSDKVGDTVSKAKCGLRK